MLLCAALLLSSCSAASEQTPSEDAVRFTDALGREVSVKKSPSRVCALIGSFAEVWQLAGGSICAAAEDAWEDFGLELEGAVNIGGAHSPSAELVISSRPELVLASASTAADVSMCGLLENAGITVVYFDVDGFSDYLAMLRICTEITGREDLYEKNGMEISRRIEKLLDEASDASISGEERKILLLRVSSGTVKAKDSKSTVLGTMLCELGCINIADSEAGLLETLSVESVIKQDPYRIFAVTMGNDTKAAEDNLWRMLEENPAWGGLRAVKEGRVHVMDRALFNLKPNVRWADAYEILAQILYGER